MRWTLASGLIGAWLYAFVAWRGYPNGAAATHYCLLGFVALGLAPWVAPLVQWSRFLRAAGAIVAFIAFALLVLLGVLLRNGL
jgi:hypothetical protein